MDATCVACGRSCAVSIVTLFSSFVLLPHCIFLTVMSDFSFTEIAWLIMKCRTKKQYWTPASSVTCAERIGKSLAMRATGGREHRTTCGKIYAYDTSTKLLLWNKWSWHSPCFSHFSSGLPKNSLASEQLPAREKLIHLTKKERKKKKTNNLPQCHRLRHPKNNF